MPWLRARQTWRGTGYRSVLILEPSLDQRRCGSSAHAANRVLSTWSPNLFPPISPRNPLRGLRAAAAYLLRV
jgi:hypothetical protein